MLLRVAKRVCTRDVVEVGRVVLAAVLVGLLLALAGLPVSE